jgi:hypothetical protein
VTAGRGLTLICKLIDFVGSEIEVAVTVAVNALVTGLGALYVAELVVWPLSVPLPERLHCTPALFVSFATEAVRVAVCA